MLLDRSFQPQVIEDFKDKIVEANQHTAEDIEETASLYAKVLTTAIALRDALRIVPNRDESIDHEGKTADYTQWLSVAVLGISRIFHTQWNRLLKDGSEISEEVIVKEIGKIRQEAENWLKENNPDFTITGDPIHWKLEMMQDWIRTLELTGKSTQALQEAQNAVRLAEQLLKDPLTDEDLRSAIFSALSVIYMRWGSVTGSQRKFGQSLDKLHENQDVQNIERQRYVAQKAIQHAGTDWRHFEVGQRLRNVFSASRILLSTRNRS